MTWFLGGPSYPDLYESLFATQSIAHGHFSCLFSAVGTRFPTSIAPDSSTAPPLYPLVTGSVSALLRLGHSVPFPAPACAYHHCLANLVALNKWIGVSGSRWPTMRLAYLTWISLAAGVVAVMRSSKWRGRGSEPLTLILISLLPSVFMRIGFDFHPEYVMAAGLALCGIAAARRQWWAWSGVLLGLAALTQQYTVLVAAMLFVCIGKRRRWRWLIAMVSATAVVVGPLALVTSGRAFSAAAFGSSRMTPLVSILTHATGGTVLWELHLHGGLLFLAARVFPILAAMVVSGWASRRFGPLLGQPERLMSVVTIALSLRLVFEVNLYGYYFMASAAALVVLDAVSGRIRVQVLVWVGLVSLAFNPIPPGFASRGEPWGAYAVPFMTDPFAVAVLAAIAQRSRTGRNSLSLILTFVFVLIVFQSQIFLGDTSAQSLCHWPWQTILVPWLLFLAAQPLRATEIESSDTVVLDPSDSFRSARPNH